MTSAELERSKTTVLLLLFLPLLYFLYVSELASLNFFGVGPFFVPEQALLEQIELFTPLAALGAYRAGALFAIYGLVFVIHSRASEALRSRVLLLGGLAGALVAYPLLMPGVLLLTLLLYVILHFTGKSARVKLLLLGLLYLGLAITGWRVPLVQWTATLFVALTFFRTFAALQSLHQRKYVKTPLGDFLRYQLPLPSFIITPYLGVIPPFAPKKAPRPLEVLYRDGQRLLLAGLLSLLAARVLATLHSRAFPLEPESIPAYLVHIMLRMLVTLTDTGASAGFLVGLMMLLGWDLKPAHSHPYFASSLFDYWNRFIIHFKDLQVSLFYYPTLLAMRRSRPELAVIIATAMTFLVGNNVMHLFGRYLYTAERYTLLPHAVKANFALTAVMTMALLWEDYKGRRRAAKRPIALPEGGSAGKVIRMLLTLAVVSLIWDL